MLRKIAALWLRVLKGLRTGESNRATRRGAVVRSTGTPRGVCLKCKNEPEKYFRINKSDEKRT
jgi:hypothetical protein